MTKIAALISVLVLVACGGRNARIRKTSDFELSQTKVDTWQVEVMDAPEGSVVVPHLSVAGYGELLEKLPMESVEGQPNVFRGSVLYGSRILITIDVIKEGIGVCGETEISYCGQVRLWKDELSGGSFVEMVVRFNSWKSNPVRDDQVVCKDKTIECLEHWQDFQCVYSNKVFDPE